MFNIIILWFVRLAGAMSVWAIIKYRLEPVEIFVMSFVMIVLWISAEYDEHKKRKDKKGRG